MLIQGRTVFDRFVEILYTTENPKIATYTVILQIAREGALL